MSKLKTLSLLMIAGLLVGNLAFAQQGAGKILGTVSDNEGNPLPGVSVIAKSPAMVGATSTVTDENGTFRLLALNPGVYSLTFSLQGFKTKVRDEVLLKIEQTITMGRVTLELGSLEEQITVVGQSPLIDVKSSMKSMTMSKEVFQALPKARDFASLVTILPGVNYEYRTGGIQVDGSSGSENMFYVDGSDTTNSRSGTAGQNVVSDFIEEVQVKASGYNAEFGGSMGGVVNVISRAGGNEFHGDVIGYLTGRFLDAKEYQTWRWDPTSTAVPPAVEWLNYEDKFGKDDWYRIDGVMSLGGYIFKDKLWFFGSFNPQYFSNTRPIVFTTDPLKQTKEYNTYSVTTDFQLKLTSQVTKSLRVSASGVFQMLKDRKQLPAKAGTGSMTYPYGDYGFSYPTSSGSMTADYIIGNNFVINARGGWWYSNQTDQKLLRPGTFYSFSRSNINLLDVPASLQHTSGWNNFPGTLANTKKSIRSRMDANLDLTYYVTLAGEHSWKAGFQWVRLHDDLDATYDYPAVYLNWGNGVAHPGTEEWVQGKYGYYIVNHGVTSAYGRFSQNDTDRWALYLQDTWTIGSRLTLNLGLRAEAETIPVYSPKPEYEGMTVFKWGFEDKLSPRISIVYDLFGDSSLKLYANVSRIFDVMKTYGPEESYGGFLWQEEYYSLDNYNWLNIAATGKRTDAASVGAGGKFYGGYDMRWFNLETTDPDTKPVSKDELSFGFDKKITEDIVFGARFTYDHLRYIIEDVGYATTGGELYYTGNPGVGWLRQQKAGGQYPNDYWPIPKAKREYVGLNLNLEKRFSNNWAAGVNYTLSRLWGNCSGIANSYEGGTAAVRPGATRAFDAWTMLYDFEGNAFDTVLPTDRTHYFKAYGTYRFPFGVTVGLRANAMTGLPYQPTFTLRGYPYYPYGVATDRYPFEFWADLYLEYNLKLFGKFNLQINANVDNILGMDYVVGKQLGMTYRSASVSYADIVAKNWNIDSTVTKYIPHPLYNKDTSWFYVKQNPFGQYVSRSTRLGFKFSW